MKFLFVTAMLLSCALSGVAQNNGARQLVDRQARAWEKQDFALAASDWLPDGVLIAPEYTVLASDMPASMQGYFKDFGNLQVTVKNVIVSPDGNKLAVEWDWAVTRKKDGKRGTSHDAIMVDLKGGKIASWREYYDPAASVEGKP